MGWTLLRTNTAFRGLWLAYAGSVLGSWFNQIALALVTLRLTHSPAAMGFVLLATKCSHDYARTLCRPPGRTQIEASHYVSNRPCPSGGCGVVHYCHRFHSMTLVLLRRHY